MPYSIRVTTFYNDHKQALASGHMQPEWAVVIAALVLVAVAALAYAFVSRQRRRRIGERFGASQESVTMEDVSPEGTVRPRAVAPVATTAGPATQRINTIVPPLTRDRAALPQIGTFSR